MIEEIEKKSIPETIEFLTYIVQEKEVLGNQLLDLENQRISINALQKDLEEALTFDLDKRWVVYGNIFSKILKNSSSSQDKKEAFLFVINNIKANNDNIKHWINVLPISFILEILDVCKLPIEESIFDLRGICFTNPFNNKGILIDKIINNRSISNKDRVNNLLLVREFFGGNHRVDFVSNFAKKLALDKFKEEGFLILDTLRNFVNNDITITDGYIGEKAINTFIEIGEVDRSIMVLESITDAEYRLKSLITISKELMHKDDKRACKFLVESLSYVKEIFISETKHGYPVSHWKLFIQDIISVSYNYCESVYNSVIEFVKEVESLGYDTDNVNEIIKIINNGFIKNEIIKILNTSIDYNDKKPFWLLNYCKETFTDDELISIIDEKFDLTLLETLFNKLWTNKMFIKKLYNNVNELIKYVKSNEDTDKYFMSFDITDEIKIKLIILIRAGENISKLYDEILKTNMATAITEILVDENIINKYINLIYKNRSVIYNNVYIANIISSFYISKDKFDEAISILNKMILFNDIFIEASLNKVDEVMINVKTALKLKEGDIESIKEIIEENNELLKALDYGEIVKEGFGIERAEIYDLADRKADYYSLRKHLIKLENYKTIREYDRARRIASDLVLSKLGQEYIIELINNLVLYKEGLLDNYSFVTFTYDSLDKYTKEEISWPINYEKQFVDEAKAEKLMFYGFENILIGIVLKLIGKRDFQITNTIIEAILKLYDNNLFIRGDKVISTLLAISLSTKETLKVEENLICREIELAKKHHGKFSYEITMNMMKNRDFALLRNMIDNVNLDEANFEYFISDVANFICEKTFPEVLNYILVVKDKYSYEIYEKSLEIIINKIYLVDNIENAVNMIIPMIIDNDNLIKHLVKNLALINIISKGTIINIDEKSLELVNSVIPLKGYINR